MDSDPTLGDTDGDSLSDSEDFLPLLYNSSDEIKVYDFFENAEEFEIRFILENPWLQEIGTVTAIDIINIFRDPNIKKSAENLNKIFEDMGIYTPPEYESVWEELIGLILEDYMEPPAQLFAAYRLYRENMSLEQLLDASVAVWSNDQKIAAQIILFGVSDIIKDGWRNWDYSAEYRLSIKFKTRIQEVRSICRENQVIGYQSAEESNIWLKENLHCEKPPYKQGTKTTIIKLSKDTEFVRVYTKGLTSPQGQWIMKFEEIEGLTPTQIKDKFALPYEPTHIIDVTLPAGSEVRFGIAGKIPEWGKGGGIQFDLMGEMAEFGEKRKL